MAKPQEFFSALHPFAMRVQQRTGIPAGLMMAQAALESGYGKHAPGNNFFGIKGQGPAGSQLLSTKESFNGRMVPTRSYFRAYNSPEESLMDYARLISENPRYKGVMNASKSGGLKGAVLAMGRSGYATDPNYTGKLMDIIQKNNLDQITTGQVMGQASVRGIGQGPSRSLGGDERPRLRSEYDMPTGTTFPWERDPSTFSQVKQGVPYMAENIRSQMPEQFKAAPDRDLSMWEKLLYYTGFGDYIPEERKERTTVGSLAKKHGDSVANVIKGIRERWDEIRQPEQPEPSPVPTPKPERSDFSELIRERVAPE